MLLTVPSFLSAAECVVLRQQYAAGLAAKRFMPRGTNSTDTALSGVNPAFVEPIAGRASQLLLEQWPELPALELDYLAYTRMTIGGRHNLHADGFKLDGTPNHTPQRIATAMVYLSDGQSDFAGGLIRFPGLRAEIVPRVGLLVGFLTTVEFAHDVTPVASGVRDALAVWFQAEREKPPAKKGNCIHLGKRIELRGG